MAFGEITKQLAKQAIGDTVKDIIDPGPSTPPDLATTIVGQIQAMQKALKEEDELVVLYHSGSETVRVFEIILPSRQIAVLAGLDANKATTRVIVPIDRVELTCKIARAQGKAVRVNVIQPK